MMILLALAFLFCVLPLVVAQSVLEGTEAAAAAQATQTAAMRLSAVEPAPMTAQCVRRSVPRCPCAVCEVERRIGARS